MDENKFWATVWKIVAATFMAFVVTVAGCSAHNARVIERMTVAGADPLDAKCAISGSDGKECFLRFAQPRQAK